MAESSTITPEGTPSGCQRELCTLDGDVSKVILLKTSKLNAPISIKMTTQYYQKLAAIRPAYATASLNLPEIFGVDHVEPLRMRFPMWALFSSRRQQADLTN
ncbi:hypothetical protein ABID82_000542 [Methylobacterium sp. PvP062]|uniref:Uncharacterized protein n=1 Tax=Methylobacterium radiotolerans TaxID=31998 RepID=A0ABV2N9E3_9HYPH|nr:MULTISPECIES: hypothetical protein [unclassified Methylobacterium]MBP2493644.1 hypothetical protein [Methylobacterium sp. PvP105]MBP2499983.1 hypothetical protein [Methylobacterium sp. PvP109]MCX7336312.1 hypothetical protein [Hyphomicrobiales bacterium]